ncbi:MAG: aminotransferase class V-fold PLP-dependent enzyme [Spirochaetes bacterium]|nr:aminotransferase class V-fold PLP-dependent enzyme [Spirochaetota bacterium]
MKLSRKEFLHNASYVSASALLAFAGCNKTTEVIDIPSDKKIITDSALKNLSKANWDTIRSLFTFSTRPPLNAANLCPTFDHVNMYLWQFTNQINEDVSFINRLDFIKKHVEKSKEKVCKMLGIENKKELAFVRNTSEANSIIVQGFNLKRGDEIVVWEQNHPTNYRSWQYKFQNVPFTIKTVKLDMTQTNKEYYIKSFLQQLSPKTKIVTFSHISNISGLRLPAEEICNAIKDYNKNIFIHIDGAQSLGSVVIDMGKLQCDSFSASTHKWLCGPHGAGILFIREQWIQKIQPALLGYNFYFDYPEEKIPEDASRFECLGQRNDAVFGSIGAAVDIHLHIGIKRIEERIHYLTQYTRNAITKAGLSLISPNNNTFNHGIIVIDMGSTIKSYGAFLALHNAGVSTAIIHNNKIHCTPDGRIEEVDAPTYLRICPHIYNSTNDIDNAVSIIVDTYTSKVSSIKEFIKFFSKNGI